MASGRPQPDFCTDRCRPGVAHAGLRLSDKQLGHCLRRSDLRIPNARRSWSNFGTSRTGVGTSGAAGDVGESLEDLRASLEAAIAIEDYAQAASLRDRIRALETEDPVIELRRRLREAVDAEDYEEAALVRDELVRQGGDLEAGTGSIEVECFSETITNEVKVRVRSFFLDHLSSVDSGQYVFAYQVEIINEGKASVQLLNRHWVITDAKGKVEEVRGRGVIGQTPIIRPSRYFQYVSVCPLATRKGCMQGEYEMVILNPENEATDTIQVRIGRFGLDVRVQAPM
ncbi:unnamed protein product [Ostreobium quekettii]|uniref:Protein ApaG n=1 Tax=Ostreobium quekettii TaxID=121088 RepID=A0A8S1JF95_9CHLO|nr:unnamed protein product [Ostreobium quekettii]|eukprot:evm.model.scf_812.6 EVM.evm.TU.scf_812.6   scf_812:44477-46715(-)